VILVDTVRQHLPQKYRELAKFLVVGGSAYIVDVGIFTLLSHTVLSSKVVTAKAIAILVATVFSYVLNREWSFSARGGRETHHEAMLFFLVNGLALALNLVPLAISQYLLGFNPSNYSTFTVSIANFISANVIGTIIGMAFRFWAYRKWVFPEELETHRDESLVEQAFAEAELLAGEPDAAGHPGRHEAPDHPGRREAYRSNGVAPPSKDGASPSNVAAPLPNRGASPSTGAAPSSNGVVARRNAEAPVPNAGGRVPVAGGVAPSAHGASPTAEGASSQDRTAVSTNGSTDRPDQRPFADDPDGSAQLPTR
jgi:putative flippase GtrA